MCIKRGDIYYVEKTDKSTGCEQNAGRPAIIISNNIGNNMSNIKQVVFLTTEAKNKLPTHVSINSAKYPSTALCEQIFTVSDKRLGKYYGKCTEDEMEKINKALAISIGLE